MATEEIITQDDNPHALIVRAPDERAAMVLMDRMDLEQAMAELRVVYIYGLAEPGGTVRYIGQSVDPERRLREHLMACNLRDGTHKSRWLSGLLARGLEPVMTILATCTAQDWRLVERQQIAAARLAGLALTNLTQGGDGTLGRRHTAATIAKIAASKIGLVWTPEQRARMSAARAGRKRDPAAAAKTGAKLRGRVMSAEARAKMSAAKKGRPLSAANRAALSAARKGKPHTAEHRAHLSVSVKAALAAKRAAGERA